MASTLRPNSNITQTHVTGGFADIDETSPSDTDFVTFNASGPDAAILEVGLSNPTGTPSNATINFRAKGGAGGPTIICYLYQGTTQIAASSSVVLTSSFVTYSFSPNVSAVTDWTDVRLHFFVSDNAILSYAAMDVYNAYSDTLTFSSTPGDSLTNRADYAATITEITTPSIQLGSTSSANIHAFTRSVFGEVWFVVPIGGSTSHNYYSFCVDESLQASSPVWFKGGISAAAVLDDPLLGADSFWSCLRIADATGADLYSFDKRTGGELVVDWSLTSSAFYVDEGQRRVMLSRFHKDFERQDDTVTLSITTYDEPNGSAVGAGSYSILTSDARSDFRISGRMMTMEFSGSGQWRSGKPGFEITTLGER